MSESIPDYYAVLGVGRAASGQQIQQAYRQMALLVHPDRNPDPEDRLVGSPDIRLVNEAWEVLGDPDRRAFYDRLTSSTSPPTGAGWLFPPGLPPAPDGFGLYPPTTFGAGGYEFYRLGDFRRMARSLYAFGPDLSNLSQLGDEDLWLLEVRRQRVSESDLRGLSRFRSLEVLILDDSKVTDVALQGLRSLPKLHTLSLTACPITDAAVPAVRAIESLEYLDLDETRLTDEGLLALQGHPRLAVLDLRRTKVRGSGISYLADLPFLRQLRVDGRAERVARHVFAARPEVTVL